MSSASLNRMSVPLGGQADQGLLMPKLKYRFRVFFQNFGASANPTTELTKQVMTFNRPNLSFEDITIPIYNSTLKLAGKPTWADVACEIRDDATGSVSKLVGSQLQKQMDFLEMASAASGIDYKFQTRVEILDGGNGNSEPVILEAWELYGCYLKSADYGQLSYADSAVVTINLGIAYDNANQIPYGAGAGVGGVIGRTVGSVTTGAGAAS
jgi:hypothetical protein